MRLIDADALSAFVGDLRSTLHKEQSTFKAMTDIEFDTRDYMLLNFQYAIDNAPTVEYPDQVTIKCDTEEDKQKLLSALRNVKLKAIVEDERQGDWIPVVERLPDYMDDILITFQKPNREPLVYRAVFIGGKFAFDNGDVWNWNDPEVKAWMPLPEAYKETNDETDN